MAQTQRHNSQVSGSWTFVAVHLGDEVQSVISLNPRPLKIMGTHLSARAARVFACFAPET